MSLFSGIDEYAGNVVGRHVGWYSVGRREGWYSADRCVGWFSGLDSVLDVVIPSERRRNTPLSVLGVTCVMLTQASH